MRTPQPISGQGIHLLIPSENRALPCAFRRRLLAWPRGGREAFELRSTGRGLGDMETQLASEAMLKRVCQSTNPLGATQQG